jgi:hypothetical protein
MPRMKILNSVEREVFDFPPIFNSVERKRFDFPAPLQNIAASLRTASNQLVFLLSCGYFKATKRFHPAPTFHRRDLMYVADRIGVTLEGIDLIDYPKQTMSRHQVAILNYTAFAPSSRTAGRCSARKSRPGPFSPQTEADFLSCPRRVGP